MNRPPHWTRPGDCEATQPHRNDRRFLVTHADNPFCLSVGTHLEVVRRYEVWEHHGCIPSVRDVMVRARILDEPRRGEVVDLLLEWGYEDDPPVAAATWLVGASRFRA
jgi:hypothetical protein